MVRSTPILLAHQRCFYRNSSSYGMLRVISIIGAATRSFSSSGPNILFLEVVTSVTVRLLFTFLQL